ncbi:histidine kinase [Sporanaerobium hydrogeniformans]|uniref:Histidine kinase n=1 Tax=Sporanaerobium hydrogeniformans TaxID=3072179 RepID=A0AC61D6E6_9FIRM|nr:LytTR family DNA-binding domain-containing protein [Sporanaerobium hydrogeniformans]PHV69304.1 histidine kinase [Sporanaerobium hydrogeniformans]
MKISIVDPQAEEEDEIIIKCRDIDEGLLQMIYGIKMHNKKLMGMYDGKIHLIEPIDIYYFEAVDNRVFMYCKDKVFESKLKLYEIEHIYAHTDYFRASKSTILNLSKIKNLTPAFNGRFEALLQNGERVIISRQYVVELKKKLGL